MVWVWQSNEIMKKATRINRKYKIKNGGPKTGSNDKMAYRQVSNGTSTATTLFQASSIQMGPMMILYELTGSANFENVDT